MLEIENANAGSGDTVAERDVSLSVPAFQVAAAPGSGGERLTGGRSHRTGEVGR